MSFEELYSIPFVTPPFGIIEVTGPHGVGKTLFALTTGADMSRVCVLDCERSAEPYKSWGFSWVDVVGRAARGGFIVSPEHVYLAALDAAEKIPESKYDVIVVDNISKIEDGIVEHVKRHPEKYGLSRKQADNAGGLIWGPIKALEQTFLLGLKARAKMVIVTVHLGPVWGGKKPIPGLFKPKGKDVLRMLATLSIWLRFSQGPVPAGLVMKARMAKIGPDGLPHPVLPPKLPRATWAEIRRYMAEPFNPDHPKPDEVPTAEEWHILRGTLSKEQREMMLAFMKASEEEEKTVEGDTESRVVAQLGGQASGQAMTVQAFIAELTKRGIALSDAMAKLGVNNLADISSYEDALKRLDN